MIDLFGIKDIPIKEVSEKEGKGITIFTYLTDIMSGKKGNIHIEADPSLSKFDTFMILRFLSLDEGYLPFVNIVNGFQDNLTKEEAYKLLVATIPKSRKFLNFPKKTNIDIDESDVELIAKYFVCSKNEVKEFIKLNLLSKTDISKIIEMFGGKV